MNLTLIMMFIAGLDINIQVVEHAKHCTQDWLKAYPDLPMVHQQIAYFHGNCFEMKIDSMCRYDRIYIGTNRVFNSEIRV